MNIISKIYFYIVGIVACLKFSNPTFAKRQKYREIFKNTRMASNMLVSNGERLGIRDPSIIQKAEGFLRLLNSKPVAKTINDVSKVIMCLDLAAVSAGVIFDKETALKLTNLRKSVYQNNLNNIEKILNLDKPITASEVCVQFSCMEARDLAEKILQKYQKCDTKIKDMRHPQYVAAAVYTSCKLNGIKIDKSQIKVVSRLKTAQWNMLIEEFSRFSSSLGLANVKKGKPKNKVVEEEIMEIQDSAQIGLEGKDKEDVIEEYEVWKERMLREASAQILQNEINEDSF